MPSRLDEWRVEGAPALERLVEAVRDLIAMTVTSIAPPEVADDAARRMRAVTELLRTYVPDPLPPRYAMSGDIGAPHDLMPFDPLVGRLSPLSPPLELGRDGELTVATVCFSTPYEGPPGCVHGGIIAAAFDQVLNVANLRAGVAGLTASLEVRYRRPTPLRTQLRFEAPPPTVEGKQVRTTGIVRAGDTVTAEATGTFVQLPPERLMALASARR